MSSIDFLLERFANHSDKKAIIWKDEVYTYAWLLETTNRFIESLTQHEDFEAASNVALEADFSPTSIAMMMALTHLNCVVIPLTDSVKSKRDEFLEIAEAQLTIIFDDNDQFTITALPYTVTHELTLKLKALNHPGLIIFSSGSTGKSKAAIHDFVPLLEKFRVERHAKTTITFLLFDHIGGINTMLYILSNGGAIVTVQGRSTREVAKTIQDHKVQNLPTSPTFINLILMSGVFEKYDVSSLELVTYGTEPMPQSTLTRFTESYPNIRLLQTYGLSEVGIMRSKSESSDSLWVKIGGEGFETRVVDGMLEIKSKSAMLGYLNAPSPFTDDGWLVTGDSVEVKGEYFRIFGRKSEMINVGGEKVYPAEIESTILEMDGVDDVTVKGETNPITGQVVKAVIKLSTDESRIEFKKRMHAFLAGRLAEYKIPQKITLTKEDMHGDRFKKLRSSSQA